MDDKKVINPDEIIAKIKKLPKTAMICLVFGIIFAVGAIVGVIMMISGDDLGFVLIMAGVLFALMFFGIVLAKFLKSKSRLKNVNFYELKSEIAKDCKTYDNIKTYFTQNYMISNYYYAFVVRYSDIVWIYKHDKVNQNGTVVGEDLMICLANGRKEYTIYSELFCDEIELHNPNVFEGHSSENKKAYKEIVKNNKNKNKNKEGSAPAPVPTEVTNNNNMLSPSELETGVASSEEGSEPVIPEEPKLDLGISNMTVDTQKDMFDIDPLYKIPGMEKDNSDTKPTTTDFLMAAGEPAVSEQPDLMAPQGPPTNVMDTNSLMAPPQTPPVEVTMNNGPIMDTNSLMAPQGPTNPVMDTNSLMAAPQVQPGVNMNNPVMDTNNLMAPPMQQQNIPQTENNAFVPPVEPMGQSHAPQSATPLVQNELYDVNQIRNPFV